MSGPRAEQVVAAELAEAESALQASHEAMRTHGHQGITWALLQADGARVQALRAELADARSAPLSRRGEPK